jgi:hypothetical protein
MFIPLNGPGVQGALSVSTTAVELKVGATPLDQRAVVTIQPLDGDVYYGYTSGVTASTGTKIFKGQVYPLEATDQLPVYIVAASGTIDVRITEVS